MDKAGLVSDEPVLARGLRSLLAAGNEFDLVELGGNLDEAAKHLGQTPCDLLIVDVGDEVQIQQISTFRRVAPDCKIVLWGRSIPVPIAHHAVTMGVRGILRKNLPEEILLRCLRSVKAGEVWFDRSLTQSLLDMETVKLSRREVQLLALIVEGSSNKEISDILGLSEGTVKFYLSRLFRKVRVQDRFELALYGLKNLGSGLGGGDRSALLSARGLSFVVDKAAHVRRAS
jgi:two-component system nitrate/nitrite response regulator NarL